MHGGLQNFCCCFSLKVGSFRKPVILDCVDVLVVRREAIVNWYFLELYALGVFASYLIALTAYPVGLISNEGHLSSEGQR